MATEETKTQPDEPLADAWQRVVTRISCFSRARAPVKTLVLELAQSDAAQYAIPKTSHLTPWFYAAEYGECVPNIHAVPIVAVEYWDQVDKFRIRFHRFQGVPYDQKWCELPEAIATLMYALRRLQAKPDEQSG